VYSADEGAILAQAFELLARHLGRVFSHADALIFSSKRIEIAAVVALTQLVLDGLQLLAQDSLALMLGELLAYLRVNLLLDLDQLDLALAGEPAGGAKRSATSTSTRKRGALFGRQIHGGRGDVAQARGILVLIQDLAASSGMSGEMAMSCLATSYTAMPNPSISMGSLRISTSGS